MNTVRQAIKGLPNYNDSIIQYSMKMNTLVILNRFDYNSKFQSTQ